MPPSALSVLFKTFLVSNLNQDTGGVFPFRNILHGAPRDIFPGHGDLGMDFHWGSVCKKIKKNK